MTVSRDSVKGVSTRTDDFFCQRIVATKIETVGKQIFALVDWSFEQAPVCDEIRFSVSEVGAATVVYNPEGDYQDVRRKR